MSNINRKLLSLKNSFKNVGGNSIIFIRELDPTKVIIIIKNGFYIFDFFFDVYIIKSREILLKIRFVGFRFNIFRKSFFTTVFFLFTLKNILNGTKSYSTDFSMDIRVWL